MSGARLMEIEPVGTAAGDSLRMGASSLTEDDRPLWAAPTTYGLSAEVVRSSRVWRSAQAGNTGHDPATDSGAWWILVGATNRWCAFDGQTGARAEATANISYRLDSSIFLNAVGLFGLTAESVRVQVEDTATGAMIYNVTRELWDDTEVVDPWSYFTEPIVRDAETVFEDVPIEPGTSVRVFVQGSGTSPRRVGEIAVGKLQGLGDAVVGTAPSFTSYSRVERDDFGKVAPLKRPGARRVEYHLRTQATQIRRLQRLFARVDGEPVVVIAATPDYGTYVYGLLQGAPMPIEAAGHVLYTLDVEELQ